MMFVINNTIIDINFTLLEEAQFIFRLLQPNESIVFCLQKNDANSIEDKEMGDLINNRFYTESNFDFMNNEVDKHNSWIWLKLNTYDEMAKLLELDFFLYYCLVLSDEFDLMNYKYMIIMNDSYQHEQEFYRALTIRTKKNENVTDLLEKLVSNSERSDIG